MSLKRKLLIAFAVFTCALTLLSAWLIVSTFDRIEHTKIKTKTSLYTLKEGSNARQAALDLFSEQAFSPIIVWWVKRHPEYLDVKKGEYLVDGSKTLPEILEDMVEGKIVENKYDNFTVIEGTTFDIILEKIEEIKYTDNKFKELIGDHEKFIKEALEEKPELLELIKDDKFSMEGLISPATYPLSTAHPMFNLIKHGMIRQLSTLKKCWEQRDPNIELKSPYEALILASLIERETFLDAERSKISAVFHNRLKMKMRLQTDPAVMYGISTTFKNRLKKSDLTKDTPYNTYTRAGLPPTPISMPQEKSIYAALHPDKTDALYFVAKDVSPKAGHIFTSSIGEHNKAVALYRKKVKDYLNQQNTGDKAAPSDIDDGTSNDAPPPEDDVAAVKKVKTAGATAQTPKLDKK